MSAPAPERPLVKGVEDRIVDLLIQHRYLAFIVGLVLSLFLAAGGKNLYFENDYLTFFDRDDPQRVAHEAIQEMYTKSDNLIILVHNPEQGVFNTETLEIIEDITAEAWQLPYAIRVDSITNYQYSYAEDDDLIVEDLVFDAASLDASDLDSIREITASEVQLNERLVSADGRTTMVAVSHEFPVVDYDSDPEEQERMRQIRDKSPIEVLAVANDIRDRVLAENPHLEIHLLGQPVINQSFNDSSQRDAATLIPAMYLIVALLLVLFFRSFASVVGALLVIGLATAGGMGFAGWVGFPITMITTCAPVIILTIAVCDSVHLQVIYLRFLAEGQSPLEAMHHSLKVNLAPIALTSLTTAIGFLTLNFAESPNFRQLGNISAVGVMLAMFLTLTLLPALQILLVKKHKGGAGTLNTGPIAELIIRRSGTLFAGSLVVAFGMMALIPLNQVDDDPIKYFDPGIPYRDAADFSQDHLPGIKNINFSYSCGESGCVHEPEYLASLKRFVDYLSAQPGVVYVSSYIDVIQRLNRNMHGDDPNFYRIPDDRKLAAQYHLFYEMSLPDGLDLNNQISFDQSASKVVLWTGQMRTTDFLELEKNAEQWLIENEPGYETRGASVHMMFASLGQRTVKSMSLGAVFAIIGVTLTILIAMRSIKYGFLSLVPNVFPAAMALGLWGLLVSEVNMAVSLVFSVTLGLVVDNTVHFISKYRRSMALKDDVDTAIRYAFSTVGPALLVTTAVLSIGFGLLTLSDFNVNAYMGGLTALTILVALVFDFLMLPSLLKLVDDRKRKRATA